MIYALEVDKSDPYEILKFYTREKNDVFLDILEEMNEFGFARILIRKTDSIQLYRIVIDDSFKSHNDYIKILLRLVKIQMLHGIS